MTDIFASMPTLLEKFSWSEIFPTMESYINGIVMKGFIDQDLRQWQFVQTAIVIMLIMSYVASACVIYAAVDAGVNVGRGLFATYGRKSSIGDLLYLFEAILILGWQFWGFVQAILSTSLASDAWNQLEERHAEAQANSTGFETQLSWEIAIKSSALLLMVGIVMIISGFSLAEIANPAITWIDEYDDDTNSDRSDDAAGTSANRDIPLHMVTAIYGMFMLGIMSISSYIFAWTWLDIKNGGSDFICEFENVDYSAFFDIVTDIKDLQSCLDTSDAAFEIMDLNGDGYIDRCEDATLQKIYGSSDEYAIKFSQAYTRQATKQICYQNFKL